MSELNLKQQIIEGQLVASGVKFALVVARFNSFITDRLLEGALDSLKRHGAADSDILVVKVPGSFEIPLAIKRIIESHRVDAVIALGAIIRGATAHYDLVCSGASNGIAQLSLEHNIPVTFGVITTDTVEQAIERAGSKAGNKGADAALAAIEMVSVLRQLD